MREVWLRPNQRIIWFACIPPLMIVAAGAWLAARSNDANQITWRWLGLLVVVCGVAIIAMLLRQAVRPRIAYEQGRVLFYLRNGLPIAVPAELVEAFFVGQGSAHVRGLSKKSKTVNLVARISQRHAEWRQQSVKHAIGNWSNGYVTVRGAWCEPLTDDIVRRLNRRLKEVKERITNV